MHRTLIVFNYYPEESTEVYIAELTDEELVKAKLAHGLLLGEADHSQEDSEALDWINSFISESDLIECVYSTADGGDISLDGVETIVVVGAVE